MNVPRNVFMIGIGGIGMSALAQYLQANGHTVSGSDKDGSPVVTMLVQKGVAVTVGHDQCSVPAGTGLLVYSDAVPASNVERMRAREMGIPEMSYFEALGEVSKNARTIAVAGTHGKTTTTGMLAAILKHAGKEPTTIVGSIVRDFGSNFLPGKPDLFVVEACEYRDHLLKLSPQILVITNVELDHTDYFPDIAALQETFRTAARSVPHHGAIITSPGSPNVADVLQGAGAKIVDYHDVLVPELKLIGEFNKQNARAAKAAAKAAFPDIADDVIDEALANFQGSWRRFEYRGETPSGAMVYDDYAHHPTSVAKTVEAAREKFPGKKIVVAFQPHLYSRTKSLLNDFAAALATADEVIVAPIYAAREVDDGTVSSEMLAAAARSAGGRIEVLNSFEVIRYRLLEEGPDSLIITMGAGDIYKIAEQIAD